MTHALERTSAARREAARHVVAYLLRPGHRRPPLTLADDAPGSASVPVGLGAEEVAALLTREAKAVEALVRALLERGTLASPEADLIVDVVRGDATPADLRHYRAITRQSRCGLDG